LISLFCFRDLFTRGNDPEPFFGDVADDGLRQPASYLRSGSDQEAYRTWFSFASRLSSQLFRIVRRLVEVNGEPGILTLLDGRVISVLALEAVEKRILTIYQALNAEKLKTSVMLPKGLLPCWLIRLTGRSLMQFRQFRRWS
jgi:hypothetical protein